MCPPALSSVWDLSLPSLRLLLSLPLRLCPSALLLRLCPSALPCVLRLCPSALLCLGEPGVGTSPAGQRTPVLGPKNRRAVPEAPAPAPRGVQNP